jgi:DNA-binding CsgD family transcriptional regulator
MTLAEFVVGSHAAARVDELQALFLRYVAQFGFGYFIVGPTSLRSSMARQEEFDQLVSGDEEFGQLSNYPAAWLDHYAERGYVESDPIYLETTRALRPFSWDEVVAKTADEPSLRVMREAGECGLRNGLGLAVYGRRGTVIGFGFSGPEAKPRLDERARGLVHAGSFQFYTAYSGLLGISAGPARDPVAPISEREREMLCWIAAGRTKSEAADLLAVSEACVKRRCESVFRKLEVSSLAAAVSEAIRRGLIDPF